MLDVVDLSETKIVINEPFHYNIIMTYVGFNFHKLLNYINYVQTIDLIIATVVQRCN